MSEKRAEVQGAPERIWVQSNGVQLFASGIEINKWTAYVRADKVSELEAEVARLKRMAVIDLEAALSLPAPQTKYCTCANSKTSNPCIVCGKPKFIDPEWLKRKLETDPDEGEIGAGFEVFPLPAPQDASPAQVSGEAWRYVAKCLEMADGGKYQGWSRLAELLAALSAQDAPSASLAGYVSLPAPQPGWEWMLAPISESWPEYGGDEPASPEQGEAL